MTTTNPRPFVMIAAEIPVSLDAFVQAYSAKHDRSRSWIVREALQLWSRREMRRAARHAAR